MNQQLPLWMTDVFLAFGLLQFFLGVLLLVSQRNYLKQLLGMKIMLQGVALILISEGWQRQDVILGEAMVISAYIVEAVVFAMVLSLLIQLARKSKISDISQIKKVRDTTQPSEKYG